MMNTPPHRNHAIIINRQLLLWLVFLVTVFFNVTVMANAAATSINLHKDGFDNMPGGTINLDFVPDLSKADITCTGSFEFIETDLRYQIVTETGNTNGSTVTDNGSAKIRWNDAGTDSDGDSVDVVLDVSNFTHSGNSARACVMCYDKGTKLLWNGANVLEDGSSWHATSADFSMHLLKHGTDIAASGTYLLAFADIDQSGERIKILDGADNVYTRPDCTCTITENNTLFSGAQNDDTNSLLSGFIAITNNSPSWRMMVTGGAATTIFQHFDQYDFTASTTTGGTITSAGATKVNWHTGKTYKMTPNPGYHMKKLSVDGTVVPNADTYSFSMATSDHTIDVEWAPNAYRIAYNANGGTGIMPDQEMKYDDEANLTKNIFTRIGYTFTGWKMDDKNSGTSYMDEDPVNNLTSAEDNTVTMYAQWLPNRYIIKYNANAADAKGIMPNQAMQYDVAANLTMNAFIREGYRFTGWKMDDAASGTPYSDEQSVKNLSDSDNGTVTMYAQWIPSRYTIKFDKNRTDALGTTASMDMTFDIAKSLTRNGFESPSSKFAEWNTQADGTGKSYKDMQDVKNLTATDGETVTLYAIWSTNTYNVTFIDGLTGTSITSVKIAYGGNATPPTKPSHIGYTAVSWDGTYTSVTSNRTITLTYRPNEYCLAFDPNGGTGAMSNQTMTYDTSSKISKNRFERAGYSFIGWKLENKTTGTDYSDEQEVKNLTDVDGNVLTFYAQWTPNKYSIRYEPNGGTGTMPNQTMTYDISDKLSSNAFERAGYTFIGWRRDDARTGTQYRNRQEVVNLISSNGGITTMYAQWTQNAYTVTFIDGFSGSTISTVGVNYGHAATEPSRPRHAGYTATGWDKDFANIKNDTTVTLHYRPNRYTIKFDGNSTGAIGMTPDVNAEYDKQVNLTKNGYSLNGHKWLMWTTDKDGNGQQYSDKQSVMNLASIDGATVTLYAQWKTNRYSITFIDGKTNDVISRQEVEYGKGATAPEKPVHKGYLPSSWSNDFSSIKSDMTIVVTYTPIKYTIKFNANCNAYTGSMVPMTMEFDQDANLTENGFNRLGYRFIGWATSSNGAIIYQDKSSIRNLADVNGDTINLYAVWDELNHASITYMPDPSDGGLVSNMLDSLNPTAGEAKGSKATPRDGYEFIGWYDDEMLVTNNDEFIPEKPQNGWVTKTYTAKFKKKTFKVIFMSKSNDVLKEETVEYGNGATAPDAPNINGYEFIGWDKKFDNITEDVTVTAVYKELLKQDDSIKSIPEEAPHESLTSTQENMQNDLMQTGVQIIAITISGSISIVGVMLTVIKKHRMI